METATPRAAKQHPPSLRTCDRHFQLPTLFLVWVLLAAAVSVLSLDFHWITWGGETFYLATADSLIHTGRALYQGSYNKSTPVLYPAMIAPGFLFDDVFAASSASRLLNAFYFASVIFPVFMTARWVMPWRRAFVVAVLAPLVGTIYYTGFFIAENIYYPLFYWLVLAVARLLAYGGWRNAGAAAVTAVAAYLTKSSALAPCIAAILSLATAMFTGCREGDRRRIANHWVALLFIAIIATALAAMVGWRVAAGITPLPYWDVFEQLRNTLAYLRLSDLALWEARSVGQIGTLAGGGMLALALPALVGALGRKSPRNTRALAIVSIWNLICVTGLAAWFNGYLYGELVERHVFMLLPLLLIWAAAETERRRFRLLALAALPFVMTVFFVPEYEYFNHGAMISGLGEIEVRAGTAVLVLGVTLLCTALAWQCRYYMAFLLACAGWLAINILLVAPMQYVFYGHETARNKERNLPVVRAMCDLVERPANIFFNPRPGTVLKDQIIKDYTYFCRDFLSPVNPAVPLPGRPIYGVVDRGAPPLDAQASWTRIQSIGGVDIYRKNP